MLTKDEATVLTDRIRVTQDTLDDDIIAAFKGEAHIALGYKKWVEYARKNFPKFKQSPEKRLETVIKMSEAKMSTRSIGAALGIGTMTASRDMEKARASSTKGVPIGTVAGIPDPVEPEPVIEPITEPAAAPVEPPAATPTPKPVKPKAVKPKGKTPSTKQSRKYIEAYADIVAKNPDWTIKQVAAYLVATYPALTAGGQKFGHQDVGRLRMWMNAPAPIRDAFYAGQINAAVGETILNGTMAKYLDDVDKINLLDKVVAGLIGSSAPAVRMAMSLLPSTSGSLKARWLNPDEAMTYDDLVRAKLDMEAELDRAARRSTEFAAHAAASIKIDYGIKTEKWIDGLDAQIDLVEAELPAIMALTFQAIPMAEKIEAASGRLWELAQTIRNKGVKPKARAAATSYIVVDI